MITAQITGDANDSIQWTIRGAITINGTTYDITEGRGEMSNIDRLTMNGTATDVSGQSYRWCMEGLAALYSGTVIGELNGSVAASTNSDSSVSGMDVTYIMNMS